MTWQPIETAPRDGTKILLITGMGIQIARWFASRGEYGPGWCVGATIVHPTRDAIVNTSTVTHWMPLPEPPVRP